MVAPHQRVGNLGEEIAARHLQRKGFLIIRRNYRKKWGEIDIIAKSGKVVHFIEVKSVSRESANPLEDTYRPEENVHPWKLKRLSRTIQSYLLEESVSEDTPWQFDVVVVFIQERERRARIRILEDVVL